MTCGQTKWIFAYQNTTSGLCTADGNSRSQYPHHSIRMVAPEQDNFSLGAFSVNRETQKRFNYSNNFQLQDPSAVHKFVLYGYGWP